MKTTIPVFSVLVCTLLACSPNDQATAPERVDTQVYTRIQEQLLDAQPGDIIEIPEGHFVFDRPLSLEGVSRVTLRGAGMDKTVLSFKDQRVGAEGIRVSADSVLLEGFTVTDTKGDAIKVQDSKAVTFRRINTTWSGGANAENGGYGLYPVACDGVLIDSCEASYASDAGIYVGQSHHVVVRNTYAHHNVAGIEIENCTDAEVYQCRAIQNTGGILVFDLPGLPAGNGRRSKIHHNQVHDNNLKNFAPEGNMVAIVAPGSGIILLAAKETEVFENDITDHKTIGLAIASYHITELKWTDPQYDPFTWSVFIHDNRYQRKKALPDMSKDFGKMVNLLFKGKPQDVLYDGILDEKRPAGKNPMEICIREQADGLRFASIDAAHDFKSVVTDMSGYDCAPSSFVQPK
ncbi:MAG: parallel beta-helix domain-containing protein [Haliscomenobacter sp.]